MDRRSVLLRAATALGAALAASRAGAATESPAETRLKVVYHLSDLDKVHFVLGNIQNHLDGAGGPTMSPLRWWCTARRCGRSRPSRPIPRLTQDFGKLSKAGVGFAACGNTMKAQKITLGDLLPGFVNADKGGVVRIAELQSQGYLYLRP
jgi:hypothetical protein